ncbi:MAG: hypothetical protein SGJ04_00125 [Bacteroidota bacterium]|nr:hypothetical protein [Bacteroidota bacterium]
MKIKILLALLLAFSLTNCEKLAPLEPSQNTNKIKYLDRIEIVSYPNAGPGGTNWDPDSTGPDMYLDIKIGTKDPQTTEVIYQRGQDDLPVIFSFTAANLPLTNEVWSVSLYDNDRPESPDQLMHTISFSGANLSNPFISRNGPYNIAVYYKYK